MITETAGQPLKSIKPIQTNHTATQCISKTISVISTAWQEQSGWEISTQNQPNVSFSSQFCHILHPL